MCTTPKETCLRSFFLKVFFLPFFSGAAAPPAAAAGFAILVVGRSSFARQLALAAPVLANDRRPTTDDIVKFLPPPSSCWRLYLCVGPCGFARWCACAVRGPAGCDDGGSRDKSRFR